MRRALGLASASVMLFTMAGCQLGSVSVTAVNATERILVLQIEGSGAGRTFVLGPSRSQEPPSYRVCIRTLASEPEC